MPDEVFADLRLARLYDPLEGPRDDLDHYVALTEESAVALVLDVGCGTGELALRLAARGIVVTGVDPATASLAVARVSEALNVCDGSRGTLRTCGRRRSTSWS